MQNKTNHFICVVLILLTLTIGMELNLYMKFFNSLLNFQLKSQNYTTKNQIELEQDKVELEGIIAINQYPNYPTGCESVSLYILLRYYNIDITIEKIIATLPKGKVPTNHSKNNIGGNPDREFLGDPKKTQSLGVYNKPIAQTANKFKKGAIARNGLELDEIKAIIKKRKSNHSMDKHYRRL